MMNRELTTSTGNKSVDAVGTMNLSGNVIPQSWYKTIVKETGKPYLAAIVILADIVYWYRPTEERDEATGQIVAMRRKFKADMLQRSYAQIAEQFGITKRDATNAIVALEKLGVIKRVFRKVEVGGMTLSNVLFIDLNPDRLRELTYPDTPMTESGEGYHRNEGHPQPKSVTPKPQIGETYTESTQKTTQETSKRKKKEAIPSSVEDVKVYIQEMGYGLDAQEFWDKNEMRGWKQNNGKPIEDWKACVRLFERNRKKWESQGVTPKPQIAQHTPEEQAAGWGW